MSAASSVVGGVVSGWIACSFDDVTLLIPMEDAGARTEANELVPPKTTGLELGSLSWQDALWPAYRLDGELVPVTWELGSTEMVFRCACLLRNLLSLHCSLVLAKIGIKHDRYKQVA